MKKLRIGKQLTESQDWFESIDAVDALYKQDIDLDDNGEWSLDVRDFLSSHGECSTECYNTYTAHHLMHSLDSYAKMWGGTDVTITEKARFNGVATIGPPESGKSVFLLNCCNQDLLLGMTAVALIDPSGQLSREVYSLAKMYKRKVTYLSKENPCLGLNIMLAPFSKEQRAELVIAFLNHITLTTSSDNSATTRMRNVVYQEVINLIDKNRPRLDALLEKLRLKRDPKNQFAIDGVVARLESILSDPAVHKILCSEESIDWQEVVKKREVILVDTFGFGDLPRVALGSAMTFLIRENFLSIRREQYNPLAFYIDEAHLFVDETFFHLIKMGRKFKLMITLATQDFATIPQSFKHVMLSNLGTFVALNPGMRESREISEEFRDMDARQLKFTDKFHAAVKTPGFEGVVEMTAPPFVNLKPLPVYEVTTNPMWFTEEACQ